MGKGLLNLCFNDPEVGLKRQFKHLKRVLFPEPFFPIIAVVFLVSILMDMLFKTLFALKVTKRLLVSQNMNFYFFIRAKKEIAKEMVIKIIPNFNAI